MGMLSGFVKGIAGGVADVATRRSKELRDDELIAKREEMELAREQRIAEAQEKNRAQDRGDRLDDYAMQRTDKLSDYAMQRQDNLADSDSKFERDKALNAEVRAESRLEREDIRQQALDAKNDPNSYEGLVREEKLQQIRTKNEQDQLKLDEKKAEIETARQEKIAGAVAITKGGVPKEHFWTDKEDYASELQLYNESVKYLEKQGVDKNGEPLSDKGADSGTGMLSKGGKPSDEAVIKQMLKVESGGEKNPDDAVSEKGARHAMQVMPATARDPGIPGVEGIKNESPEEYNRVGREYISAMRKQYGDDDKAFAAYNAGPGAVNIAVSKAIKTGKNWKEFLPSETKDYIRKMNAGLGKEDSGNANQGSVKQGNNDPLGIRKRG